MDSEEPLPQKSPHATPLSARSSSLRDVERPDDIVVFDGNNSKYMSQNYRRAAGASYVLAMGVCGIVLVALASSLKDLAKQVDKTSIQASTGVKCRGFSILQGSIQLVRQQSSAESTRNGVRQIQHLYALYLYGYVAALQQVPDDCGCTATACF